MMNIVISKKSEASPNKRIKKEGGGADENAKPVNGGLGRKISDNLDFRLRVVEAEVQETFKIPTDAITKSLLFTNMGSAKEAWQSFKPDTKAEHEWGPERWTIGVSLMQYIGKLTSDDAKLVLAPLKDEIEVSEALCLNLCQPNLTQQHKALQDWTAACKDKTALAEWLLHLQYTQTKKKDAHLLKISVRSTHQLAAAMPFIRYILRGNGAQPLAGTALKGPAFHSKK
jgi:hypothetical protein